MGKRLGSYKDLGGGGKANWIDSWKDEGLLICVLHREPPWTRVLHSFRRITKDEGKDGVSLRISWFPFVCWEEDDYHKGRRFEKRNPPRAQKCPACRLIEHFEMRDDLADDDVVFRFKAGREEREIVKVDLIGKGQSKRSFMDDLTGKTDFVLAVIPYQDPGKGVCLTNEKWSLGQALFDRIRKDITMYGEDEGDPEKSPIVYSFEYDSKNTKYGVSRYVKGEVTDQIRALWEGPAPDASRFVRHGNPVALLDSMRASIAVDGVPLDEIFEPALEEWGEDEEGEGTSFDPDEIEKDVPKKDAPKKDAPKKDAPKKDAPKNGHAKAPEKTEAKKESRPTRQTKKVEPPPPKKDVIVYACEACGADWPEDQPKCPGCGLEAVVEPDPPKAKGKPF